MTTDLSGKIYVVTGGFSGIGLAVVKNLLAQGAAVHALDLGDKCPEITTEDSHQRLRTYTGVDVSSRASVSNTFKSIFVKSPTIDGIVNNAGIAPLPESADPIESDERFSCILDVNMKGTWNTATEYFRHILDDPPSSSSNQESGLPEGIGSVVNVASTGSMHAFPGMTAYCTSKHAVLGMTRCWAKEFGPRGVRVNCVAPGGTDTPLSGPLDESIRKAYTSLVPLGRLARPEEMAEVIVFLLSARASFINGQMVPVEGGIYSF